MPATIDQEPLSFPQTNLQLSNQLLRAGYPEAEIEGVHVADDLAARLYASGFQGFGKPFLAHGVGTAGILGGLRVPASVIAAGLLHAAYTLGEFGDGQPGSSDARRQQMRRASERRQKDS